MRKPFDEAIAQDLDEDEITQRIDRTVVWPPEAESSVRRRVDHNAITLRSIETSAVDDMIADASRRRAERDMIVIAATIIVSLEVGGLVAAGLAVGMFACVGVARWALR